MKLLGPSLLLLACGGRTPLDVPPAAVTTTSTSDGGTCADEIIASDSIGSQVLAVDGDAVFWVTANGVTYRHDASGTTMLCTDCYAESIALDATNIYGAGYGDTIGVLPRAGGSITKLDAPGAFAVAVRGGTLYYLTQTSVVALTPASAATTPTTIVDGLASAEYFAVDDTNVYVSCGAGIVRASVLGTEPPATLATTSNIGPVAAYGGTVYYVDDLASNGGGVFEVPAVGGTPTALPQMEADLTGVDLTVDASGVYEAVAIDPEIGAMYHVDFDGSSDTFVDLLIDGIVSAVRTTDQAVYYTVLPQNSENVPNPAATPVVVKKCKA